jgi:hypothetical protein
MVWLLEFFILEEKNLISKSKRHDPSGNTGRRTIWALTGTLCRGTDPKSLIILSRNPRIVNKFGTFLWLSEDLVFFYFEK